MLIGESYRPKLASVLLLSGAGLAVGLAACSNKTIIEEVPYRGATVDPDASPDETAPTEDAGGTVTCSVQPAGSMVNPGDACGACFVRKCQKECTACSADAACKKAADCVADCGLDADCANACSVALKGGPKTTYDGAFGFEGCAWTKCKKECFLKNDLGDTCHGDAQCADYCIRNVDAPDPAVGFCTKPCEVDQDCAGTNRFGVPLRCFAAHVCYPGCSSDDDCKQYSKMSCHSPEPGVSSSSTCRGSS